MTLTPPNFLGPDNQQIHQIRPDSTRVWGGVCEGEWVVDIHSCSFCAVLIHAHVFLTCWDDSLKLETRFAKGPKLEKSVCIWKFGKGAMPQTLEIGVRS